MLTANNEQKKQPEIKPKTVNAEIAVKEAIKGIAIMLASIARTIKGKGVSFMEDDNNWHYRIPKEDEVQTAHRELGLI